MTLPSLTQDSTPTRDAIEAARQAWLAANRAINEHTARWCAECQHCQPCQTLAALDITERATWRSYERTKGGHRGYL